VLTRSEGLTATPGFAATLLLRKTVPACAERSLTPISTLGQKELYGLVRKNILHGIGSPLGGVPV